MAIPSFDLKVVQNDRTTRITPSGELDIASAPEFESAIAEATAEPGAELILDLRELTFMDSTGLRALAQTNARADEAGFALSAPRSIGTMTTWCGATAGGTHSPSSSPWVITSAPTSRVDAPQDVV